MVGRICVVKSSKRDLILIGFLISFFDILGADDARFTERGCREIDPPAIFLAEVPHGHGWMDVLGYLLSQVKCQGYRTGVKNMDVLHRGVALCDEIEHAAEYTPVLADLLLAAHHAALRVWNRQVHLKCRVREDSARLCSGDGVADRDAHHGHTFAPGGPFRYAAYFQWGYGSLRAWPGPCFEARTWMKVKQAYWLTIGDEVADEKCDWNVDQTVKGKFRLSASGERCVERSLGAGETLCRTFGIGKDSICYEIRKI